VTLKQVLLETPPERVSAELAETVRAFCEPIDVIRASYVGLVEVTEDFKYPHEQLSVAFELRVSQARTREGDRELRIVADRFYESMPEEIIAGGCNFLEPGGAAVWREKAQQVFAR
jgi:hypothetical protein